MLANKKEIKAINYYFKDFIKEQNISYYDENLNKTIKKIIQEKEVSFIDNWENIIALMQVLERTYNIQSITTKDNYCRFEFNDDDYVQDKRITKIEAFFSCCYKTLKRYWNKDAPKFSNGIEPFDEYDLR